MENLEKKSEDKKTGSTSTGLILALGGIGMGALGAGFTLAGLNQLYFGPEHVSPAVVQSITNYGLYSIFSCIPFALGADYLMNAFNEENTPETTTTTTTLLPATNQ